MHWGRRALGDVVGIWEIVRLETSHYRQLLANYRDVTMRQRDLGMGKA